MKSVVRGLIIWPVVLPSLGDIKSAQRRFGCFTLSTIYHVAMLLTLIGFSSSLPLRGEAESGSHAKTAEDFEYAGCVHGSRHRHDTTLRLDLCRISHAVVSGRPLVHPLPVAAHHLKNGAMTPLRC